MIPADAARTIASMALTEQPDGTWTVRVDYTDGGDELTRHDDEADARLRVLDLVDQLGATK